MKELDFSKPELLQTRGGYEWRLHATDLAGDFPVLITVLRGSEWFIETLRKDGTHERFEAVNGEYLEFGRIENKRSQRPDMHAWLLLDELFPNPGRDMVSAAEHDEIYLDVKGWKLEKLTDDQILELVRCGVMHSDEHDCLWMFA